MGWLKCSDVPGGHQACGLLRNVSGRELPSCGNTTTPHPAGDPKGPPNPASSSLAPTDVDADWMNLCIEKWVILHIPRKLFLTYTSGNTKHNGAITNSSVGDRA